MQIAFHADQSEISQLRLADVLSALTYALDMTEGQSPGHSMRCCWIGLLIAEEMKLTEDQTWELYYTLLLKDLGCSSNAARICELYLVDDLSFKKDFKVINGSMPQALKFVMSHTGLRSGLAERFRAIINIFQNGCCNLFRTVRHRDVDAIGRDRVFAHDQDLAQYCVARLAEFPGICIFGPKQGRAGLVSFVLPHAHALDVATMVDQRGVALRAGHHCNQPLHAKLGVPATLRASFYFYNTREEVDRFIEILKKVNALFA